MPFLGNQWVVANPPRLCSCLSLWDSRSTGWNRLTLWGACPKTQEKKAWLCPQEMSWNTGRVWTNCFHTGSLWSLTYALLMLFCIYHIPGCWIKNLDIYKMTGSCFQCTQLVKITLPFQSSPASFSGCREEIRLWNRLISMYISWKEI